MKLYQLVIILVVLGIGTYSCLSDYKQRADTYFASNRFDEAIELYRKAVHKNPSDAEAYLGLGKAYYAKVNQNFIRDAFFNPGSRKSSHRQLKEYQESGIFDKAINALQKVTTLDPGNYEGYLYLGMVYSLNDMSDQAITTLEKAIELDFYKPLAHFHLGLVLSSKEEKASTLDKKIELSYDNLNRALIEFDQAIVSGLDAEHRRYAQQMISQIKFLMTQIKD